jgi:hypothetical protein
MKDLKEMSFDEVTEWGTMWVHEKLLDGQFKNGVRWAMQVAINLA